MAVEAAQGGDEVFGRRASAPRVPPHDDVHSLALAEPLDLRRCGFVDPAVAPIVDDAPPVGGVGATGAGGNGCGQLVDVFAEGGDVGATGRGGE